MQTINKWRRDMERPAVILVLLVSSTLCWWLTSGAPAYQNSRNQAIVEALQRNDLHQARLLMERAHTWPGIIARLDALQDARLYDRALDVQFEYEYEDESHQRDFMRAYDVHSDTVKALVARGAKPTYRHVAIATRDGATYLAYYLLEQGAPAHDTKDDGNLISSAVYAWDGRLVRALLRKGADVNAPDDTQHSWRGRPLEAAQLNPDAEMVRILLQHGADPTLPSIFSDKKPMWQAFRARAREDRKVYGPEAEKVTSVVAWRLMKPIVEKRLGQSVTD